MNFSKGLLIIIGVVLSLLSNRCAGPGAGPGSKSLDSSQMNLISDAVFEVVVPKPVKDSLQYEKPLPVDLIPFSVRTDKYDSIGTAFAIRPNEFVSAAHVMSLGTKSQFKEVFLRDKQGKVYSIDKILKYSSNRDFVLFSLRNGKTNRFLPVNTTPRLNQKVYAVGNALGQGIVIRDGLYTSNTPEEEAGEWKWIRFSAAASPGNSGGPLLDEAGNVIGIVLGKSPNENLNYAVPIVEVVNAKEGVAILHSRMRYVLDNMDMSKVGTLNKEIGLPRTYEQLNGEINAAIVQFTDKLLKDLLAENRHAIFPNGPGSTKVLYTNYTASFPLLIMKGTDGNWDAFRPKETRDADLGKNGRLTYGTLAKTVFLSIRKPDDVPSETFYGDSKLFMDLILKGIDFHRWVESEKVKITSMGSAFEDSRFTDSYGRIWMVRTWLIEYDDTKVVTFSLPVPGGYIIMMRTAQTGKVDSDSIPDLKVLSDFVYVSYSGLMKDWREFLEMKNLLPPAFKSIDIRLEDNKEFRYKSARLSLLCGPDMMKISDKIDLGLNFRYFPEEGRTVWDVGEVRLSEDRSHTSVYSVHRAMQPPKELGYQYENNWENMAERKFPYNRSAHFRDRSTVIVTIHTRNDGPGKGDEHAYRVLYGVSLTKQGNVDQKEMDASLEKIVSNLVVYEDTADPSR